VATVRLTVEYDGSAFCGFQWQPHLRTVAGVLESVLARLYDEPVKIAAAGRTDAGVHACGQVVSFTTVRTFPFDRLAVALNGTLPDDVAVRDAAVTNDEFSARFSATERTYVYALLGDRLRSPLLARRAYRVWRPLDVDAMRAAAAPLLGEHDFRSFCTSSSEGGVTVRAVRRLEIERRGNLVRVEIAAGGFLHHMVRTIVGTLVECATGRRFAREMPSVLDARDRQAAGHTAPPHGLYLAGVRYGDGYDSFAEPPLFRWVR
jgi:tRNA pseudouridine38-40 synthase